MQISKKKCVLITIVALLIFLLCFQIVYIKAKLSFNIDDVLRKENIEDLCLTIYCRKQGMLYSYNWSMDDLLTNYDYKLVMEGKELEQHFDTFRQFNKETIKYSFKKAKYIDAEIYCILESEKNGKIFDFLSYGITYDIDFTVFFNDINVKDNDVFITFVKSFISEY